MDNPGIIEESDDLSLNRIALVRTKRGEEMHINLDKAAVAVAELFSDIDNEERGGWDLTHAWYADAIRTLRRAVRP